MVYSPLSFFFICFRFRIFLLGVTNHLRVKLYNNYSRRAVAAHGVPGRFPAAAASATAVLHTYSTVSARSDAPPRASATEKGSSAFMMKAIL